MRDPDISKYIKLHPRKLIYWGKHDCLNARECIQEKVVDWFYNSNFNSNHRKIDNNRAPVYTPHFKTNDVPTDTPKQNWPNSQIPQCACLISPNAPFRRELCTFLSWKVYCGTWNGCIVEFVRSIYSNGTPNPHQRTMCKNEAKRLWNTAQICCFGTMI